MSTSSWLVGAVERIAAHDPKREAVVSAALRLSYGQLAAAVGRIAGALSNAGLAPGARVAYAGLPNPLFIASELAVQKAGGVWMGLNPRYTEDEIAYCLADARPSLVVIDRAVGEEAEARVRAAAERLDPPPMLQAIESIADLHRVGAKLSAPETALPANIALIVYTSGTTGKPKGACLTHAGIAEAVRLYADRYAHPGLRSLMNLPINHVGSLIDLTASGLGMGGTLVCMPGFDPSSIPDVLREERVTILGQVPAMHLAIEAATSYDPTTLPHLKHLVWSGAPMPRGWIERHHGRGVELSTCYGQTECTGAATFTPPGASVTSSPRRSAGRRMPALCASSALAAPTSGRANPVSC